MISQTTIARYSQKCDEMITKKQDWDVLREVSFDSLFRWKEKLADLHLGFSVRCLIDQHHQLMIRQMEARC
jgi:hypothetical protein